MVVDHEGPEVIDMAMRYEDALAAETDAARIVDNERSTELNRVVARTLASHVKGGVATTTSIMPPGEVFMPMAIVLQVFLHTRRLQFSSELEATQRCCAVQGCSRNALCPEKGSCDGLQICRSHPW